MSLAGPLSCCSAGCSCLQWLLPACWHHPVTIGFPEACLQLTAPLPRTTHIRKLAACLTIICWCSSFSWLSLPASMLVLKHPCILSAAASRHPSEPHLAHLGGAGEQGSTMAPDTGPQHPRTPGPVHAFPLKGLSSTYHSQDEDDGDGAHR